MKKVFISYSFSRDKEFVSELKLALQNENLEPTEAPDLLTEGEISSEIISHIHSADLIIALVSKDNPNVMFETGYALGAGKDVLLIAGSETSLPTDVLSLPYVQYRGDTAVVISEIIRRIRSMEQTLIEKPSYTSVDAKLKTYFSDPEYFESIDPITFETLVEEWFKENGFVVERMPLTRDKGYDFSIKTPEDKLILVEAKKLSRQSRVSVQHIRNLLGAVSVVGAAAGVLISPAAFTSAAIALAATSMPKLLLLKIEELLKTKNPKELIKTK